jgi:hypothetical protein
MPGLSQIRQLDWMVILALVVLYKPRDCAGFLDQYSLLPDQQLAYRHVYRTSPSRRQEGVKRRDDY